MEPCFPWAASSQHQRAQGYCSRPVPGRRQTPLSRLSYLAQASSEHPCKVRLLLPQPFFLPSSPPGGQTSPTSISQPLLAPFSFLLSGVAPTSLLVSVSQRTDLIQGRRPRNWQRNEELHEGSPHDMSSRIFVQGLGRAGQTA